MSYYDLDDLKNISDLREIGGTASLAYSAFSGLRIRASDDGDKIFYQYVTDTQLGKIEIADVEYFGPDEEVLGILNMTEEEFVDDIGECTPGFWYQGDIHLLDEFIRDD